MVAISGAPSFQRTSARRQVSELASASCGDMDGAAGGGAGLDPPAHRGPLGRTAPANPPLQQPEASVASLARATAAERQYRWAHGASMEKDERLLVARASLRGLFGAAIEVVDHWDADRRAVGISRRDEPGRLVYLSVVPEQEGRFDLALALPPQPNSGLPFQDVGWRRGLVLSEVADVVASHLGLL
jgi:hypothetical protein